jgi:hypothetical protein
MTSRERIVSAYDHKDPDRTPMFEYVLLAPVADDILQRKFIDFFGDYTRWDEHVKEKGWKETVKRCAIDRLDLAQLLGHDMMYMIPNPLSPEDALKVKAADMKDSDDPVEKMTARNEEDERSLREHNSEVFEKRFLIFHYLKEEMDRRGIDLPVLAPAYGHGIWTDTDLMQTIILEPDIAREHFELATKHSFLYVKKYISLGIDQIGIGGDFAGNRLIISPESYRTMIVPEVRKLADHIRAAGCRSVNGTDGNIWPVIDDFITGCGTDGYLEVDMRAGMDLGRLKKAYGDKVTFFGNMDCGEVLSFYSHDEIKKITIGCIEAGMGRGGHIFCTSNAITASVPTSNYMAMVNAYRAYFGLSQIKIG